MTRIISGPRFARSFLTPTGSQVLTAEFDFQLAADQGVEILSVLGSLNITDPSPVASDTVTVVPHGQHSLHLDTGTLEDLPIADGEDAIDVDTEIFWFQSVRAMFLVGTTNTFGAGGAPGNSVLYTAFDPPVLAARNITHRCESEANSDAHGHILLGYHFVQFTNAELGLILATRS